MRKKMENTTPKTSTQTPIKEINYVLTAQEAQKIKILVAKEIKKFQQRIIELESENIMLKQQLGVTSDEPSTREEFTEQNPIVG